MRWFVLLKWIFSVVLIFIWFFWRFLVCLVLNCILRMSLVILLVVLSIVWCVCCFFMCCVMVGLGWLCWWLRYWVVLWWFLKFILYVCWVCFLLLWCWLVFWRKRLFRLFFMVVRVIWWRILFRFMLSLNVWCGRVVVILWISLFMLSVLLIGGWIIILLNWFFSRCVMSCIWFWFGWFLVLVLVVFWWFLVVMCVIVSIVFGYFVLMLSVWCFLMFMLVVIVVWFWIVVCGLRVLVGCGLRCFFCWKWLMWWLRCWMFGCWWLCIIWFDVWGGGLVVLVELIWLVFWWLYGKWLWLVRRVCWWWFFVMVVNVMWLFIMIWFGWLGRVMCWSFWLRCWLFVLSGVWCCLMGCWWLDFEGMDMYCLWVVEIGDIEVMIDLLLCYGLNFWNYLLEEGVCVYLWVIVDGEVCVVLVECDDWLLGFVSFCCIEDFVYY